MHSSCVWRGTRVGGELSLPRYYVPKLQEMILTVITAAYWMSGLVIVDYQCFHTPKYPSKAPNTSSAVLLE